MAKRRLKTRAEAFLKQVVNPGVFVSRFCRTIKQRTGLAVGPSERGHNSGCPRKAVKSPHASSLCTYSGTSPKPDAARASAAKILQYSRLMFWILHTCGLQRTHPDQQGSSLSSHAQLHVGRPSARECQGALVISASAPGPCSGQQGGR